MWICDSPDNRKAVEDVWRARGGQPYDIESGATIFNCPPNASCEDALVGIIDTVDEHHGEYSHDPPWSVIEVVGCLATLRVRQAFAVIGAHITGENAGGFEARRLVGSAE